MKHWRVVKWSGVGRLRLSWDSESDTERLGHTGIPDDVGGADEYGAA